MRLAPVSPLDYGSGAAPVLYRPRRWKAIAYTVAIAVAASGFVTAYLSSGDSRILVRLAIGIAGSGWYVYQEIRRPAASVADGMLTFYPSPSPWQRIRRFELAGIRNPKIFPKHVGFTVPPEEYVSLPLARFTKEEQRRFVADLAEFGKSPDGTWPDSRWVRA